MNRLHVLCFLFFFSIMAACNDTPSTQHETPISVTDDSRPKASPTATHNASPTANPTQKPTLTPINEPTTTPTINPETSSEVIYLYQREGGFAGFCDTLTVRTDEAYWKSCKGQSATVVLKAETKTQLRQLANQYGPFKGSSEDNPGGSDSMTQTIEFYGNGNEEMTGEVENTLKMIASELLREAYQTQ